MSFGCRMGHWTCLGLDFRCDNRMYINYACRQLVDFLSLEGWGEVEKEGKIRSTDN